MHPRARAAAGARLVVDVGDVLRAVAQHRQPALGQVGHDQLAGFALVERGAGFGVDDFAEKMILADVQSVAVYAFARHPRTVQLAHPVVVGHEKAVAPAFFDLRAHLGRAALAAQQAEPHVVGRHRELVRRLMRGFGKVEAVRGGGHNRVGLEVAHKFQLLDRIARRGGDDRRADFFQSVMQAERAGEHPVAETDLHDRLVGRAGGDGLPRHLLAPVVHILARVADDGGVPRGAGGGVDAHELLLRDRKHTERVGVTQVGLGGVGDVLYVGERFDFVRRHARFRQPFVVKRDVAVAVVYQRLQALKLQRLGIAAGHTFHFGVPDVDFHVVHQPFLSGAAAGCA